MNVGIDLGTTSCLISTVDSSGRTVMIPDRNYRDLYYTPSSVYIAPNSAFVGYEAENLMDQSPDLKVIRFFKRNFGQLDPIHFDEQGRPWYPEMIASLALKKLRFDAESYAAGRVAGAVITVPAHFNDPQRKAVLAAAALAEIPVIRLIDEPVAAALHYGVANSSHDQVLLVYDLGGGTFDATVLSLNQQGVYVLAKDGLTDLGGKEFDEKISAMILEQFRLAFGRELQSEQLSARTLLDLRRISEDIKIELGTHGTNYVRRTVLLDNDAVEVEISKQEFYAAIKNEIDKTEQVLCKCIKEAGLQVKDIEKLLLVGGGSMVPLIKERMRKLFSAPGQQVIAHDPIKAVARGAALHCCQVTGESEKYQLPAEFRGVSGYNVGIKALDPQTGKVNIDTVIKKNLTLPIKVSKTYYTTREDQQRLVFELVQYRDSDEDGISLGQLIVGPLPSPRQNYPIHVTFRYSDDGTVEVHANDPQTDKSISQTFARENDSGIARLATQRSFIRSLPINNN